MAIGRAIVCKPKFFMFDEPLANLDAALRLDMRIEIGKLHKSLGATMVCVPHDQVKDMTLAEFSGIETLVDVALKDGTRILCSMAEDRVFDPGQTIRLAFDPARAHLFAQDPTAKAA